MNKPKEIVIPNYYKQFKCIGADCEDTCCAGWSISIDQETLAKYKKVKDETMQRRLKKELVIKKNSTDPENSAKIKLKNGRCAFLTKEGWCDLYTHLGEQYLSHTCTLYPRTINHIGEQMEYTMTPSCIEAARQILLLKDGICFEKKPYEGEKVTTSAVIKINTNHQENWKDYFFELRTLAIDVLQDRDYTIEQRINRMIATYEQIEEVIESGKVNQIGESIKHLSQMLKEKEVIQPKKQQLRSSREMIELALRLRQIFNETKVKFKPYEGCLEELESRFLLVGKIDLKASKAVYEKQLVAYHELFDKKIGYVLENYLVNYVVERCMPLDGETPLESLKVLVLYYDLIKLHMMVAIKDKELEAMQVVDFIHLFTKVYDHGENYISRIRELSY